MKDLRYLGIDSLALNESPTLNGIKRKNLGENIKNLVILHIFHITKCLILEICLQKLNKRLPNIVSIIVKVLISKLSLRRLKLDIYLVLKNQCLTTRIKQLLETNSKSHIFKHLETNRKCKEFEIIDSASSSYRLKLKEAMHITWEKPSLNKQVKQVSTSIII